MPKKKRSAPTEIEPKDREYVRKVTIGTHTLGIFYPGSAISRNNANPNFNTELIRLIYLPPTGWENNLDTAIEELADPEHLVEDIHKYLPDSTLFNYRPYAEDTNTSLRFPREIGIADEIVEGNLDNVVAIAGLWLGRVLDLPLDEVKSTVYKHLVDKASLVYILNAHVPAVPKPL